MDASLRKETEVLLAMLSPVTCPYWMPAIMDTDSKVCAFCRTQKALGRVYRALQEMESKVAALELKEASLTEWHDGVPTEPGEYWFYGWLEPAKDGEGPTLYRVTGLIDGTKRLEFILKSEFMLQVHKNPVGKWGKRVEFKLPLLA